MDDKFAAKISKTFGKKLRIRICGILIIDDSILLIKHKGLGQNGFLWSPPGGEPHFMETMENALKREFYEETGLLVKINKFLFINEYIQNPLHAVELFFKIEKIGGNLVIGREPESEGENIISELSFLNMDEIKKIGISNMHSIFSKISSLSEIEKLNGVVE